MQESSGLPPQLVPDDALYTCLLVEQSDLAPFGQVFWARASHIGAAIEKMLTAAREIGLTNPTPFSADLYLIEDLDCEVYPDSGSEVFYATVRYWFPPEPIFCFPPGVLPSGAGEEEKEADSPEDISAGYQRSKDEEGLIEIGVNVAGPQLLPVYQRLLHLYGSYETFWYVIHNHWDEGTDQVYENPSLNTAAAIFEHLKAHPHDTVLNGHVTLTAYLDEGATNLNISDHKRIVILTYSDSVADAFEAEIRAAGFAHDEHLKSFDQRIHHWHYRPSKSLTRADLIRQLVTTGFQLWNPESGSEQDRAADT